jgi:hypothetical protein
MVQESHPPKNLLVLGWDCSRFNETTSASFLRQRI